MGIPRTPEPFQARCLLCGFICDREDMGHYLDGPDADALVCDRCGIEPILRRSLADIELPPHYGLTITGDGAELLLPNGNVLHHYGPAYSPVLIESDAWTHFIELEEIVENGDRVMGRGNYRPSVHDLLSEALDATGWTGAEKQAFLESFYAASERDVQRRGVPGRFGGSG